MLGKSVIDALFACFAIFDKKPVVFSGRSGYQRWYNDHLFIFACLSILFLMRALQMWCCPSSEVSREILSAAFVIVRSGIGLVRFQNICLPSSVQRAVIFLISCRSWSMLMVVNRPFSYRIRPLTIVMYTIAPLAE